MSIRYDLDCGDETITLELLDDGTLISYGFDIESEMIAREMGFEPHPCFGAMDEALWQAARYGNIDIVEILLVAGADVHIRHDISLLWSAENGHYDIVKLLLEHGIDIHTSNNHALFRSVVHGHTDIVKLLLEYGADVHARNNQALRLAEQYDNDEVVAILKDWIRDHGK